MTPHVETDPRLGSALAPARNGLAGRARPSGTAGRRLAWHRAMEEAAAACSSPPPRPIPAARLAFPEVAPGSRGSDDASPSALLSLAPSPSSAAASPRRPVLAGADTSERARLRVHGEWSQEGVRVWLGADRHEAVPLDRLTAPLLRLLRCELGANGFRLASLVCNGHTVFPHPDQQEDP